MLEILEDSDQCSCLFCCYPPTRVVWEAALGSQQRSTFCGSLTNRGQVLPAGSPSPGQNSAKGVVSIAPVADTDGKGS